MKKLFTAIVLALALFPNSALPDQITASGDPVIGGKAANLAPVFNVVNYGATGNGTDNDTSEIQAAIDAAEAAGGGIVFFPAGTYLVSDNDDGEGSDSYCLTVTEGITLRGANRETTIIKSSESALPIFYVATQDAVHFSDMRIYYNGTPDSGQAGIFVNTNDGDNLTGNITAFADAGGGKVTVTSAAHSLSNGTSITISGTTNYNGTFSVSSVAENTFQITDTWVSNDATGTWTITYANYYTNIERCYINSNYAGIRFNQAKLWTVQNNHIGSNVYGLYIDNKISADGGDSLISNNTFTANTTSHVYQVAAGGSRVIGNKFDGCNGASCIGYHLDVGADWATEVDTSIALFSSNSFENGDNYDIKIETDGSSDSFSKISITGNEFARITGDGGTGTADNTGIYIGASNTAAQIRAVSIVGNVFKASMLELGYCDGVTVSSNYFEDVEDTSSPNESDTVGIKTGGTSTNVSIYGNDFSEISSAADLISGSVDSELRIDAGDNAADSAELQLYLNGVLQARMFAYGDGDQVIDHEGTLKFRHYNSGTPATSMYITPSGNLVITSDLTITGNNLNSPGDLVVTPTGGDVSIVGNLNAIGDITATGDCCVADYVFESTYKLMSLDELGRFIKENSHLPRMTINKKQEKISITGGINELLVKTEEQALYILELHERLKILEARLAEKTP